MCELCAPAAQHDRLLRSLSDEEREPGSMTDQAERPANKADDEHGEGQRRSERQRAAAYLDLWERNLGHLAIHGPPPVLPAGGR